MKAFALCEAFGLTPFGPRDSRTGWRPAGVSPRGERPAARRGDTAPYPPLRRECAVDKAGRGGEGVEGLMQAGAHIDRAKGPRSEAERRRG
jgi:hypothetical protein